MRLWHKDLIPVLPRQQLLGQWRECCLIAKNIVTIGKPNHILVDKIMEYPIEEFARYGYLVFREMCSRGYSPVSDNFFKYFPPEHMPAIHCIPDTRIGWIFLYWHDDIYLRECLYNLEEKYRACGISYDEWMRIYYTFGGRFQLVH